MRQLWDLQVYARFQRLLDQPRQYPNIKVAQLEPGEDFICERNTGLQEEKFAHIKLHASKRLLGLPSPDLVKAAIDGRLPYGMGIARLTDLPAEWSKQREMLGFPSH